VGNDEYGTYLCEYPFDGALWALHLKARDYDEAEKRLKALPWARLKGLSIARVPAYQGPLVRVECLSRNTIARIWLAVQEFMRKAGGHIGWYPMLKISDVLAVAAQTAKALEDSGAPLDQVNFTLEVAGQELTISWRQLNTHAQSVLRPSAQ
jgi:hypothetical protein